jgi:O-antigen ligase
MNSNPASMPAGPAAGELAAAPAALRSRRTGARGLAPAWNPLQVQLALLFIIIISRIHQHFGVLAKVRPALLFAFGALAYAYLNPKYLSTRGVLRSPLARIMLAIFLVVCLSVPFGISIGNSGRMILFSYSKLVIVVLLAMLAVRGARDLLALMWGYVLGCGILAFFATFVFKLQQGQALARLSDLYTWDANDAGLIFITGIPLALLLAQTSRGLWRLLGLAIALLSAVAVVRTGSRGAFVGMLALGIGLLFLARAVNPAKRLAIVLAAVIGFTLFAPADYMNQMRSLLNPTEDYSWTAAEGRKELAKRGMGYMTRSPFGIGIDNFGKAECSDLSWWWRFRSIKGGVKCSAPHNSWVQAGAETGVIGLALWVAFIVGGIGAMVKWAGKVPRAWRRGTAEQRFFAAGPGYLATALLGFAAASTFVSFAWQEFAYLLVGFAVSFASLIRAELKAERAAATAGTGSTSGR